MYQLEDVPKVAKELLKGIKKHKIVAFYGEMGVGKTTLIREICHQLGCVDVATSPTFALVNEYYNKKKSAVYHFDFYRINNPNELLDIGYEDYINSGNICLIEWPEKANELIPSGAWAVKITEQPDQSRKIETEVIA